MCVAWANGCIAAGTGMDVVTSIDTLPTKNMSVQVYARESIGAVRVEDEGVVEIACLERSEEHTSELQSLMRISYAVFCLNKKTKHTTNITHSPYHINAS